MPWQTWHAFLTKLSTLSRLTHNGTRSYLKLTKSQLVNEQSISEVGTVVSPTYPDRSAGAGCHVTPHPSQQLDGQPV
jgi:hypothetical protein